MKPPQMDTVSRAHIIVIVPCYNEAQRLPREVFKVYGAQYPGVQFVFVDDGSTDATLAMLQDLSAKNPERFRVLHLERNVGKAEAVREGFLAALKESPDYIAYWDADLATPLELLADFERVLDQSPHVEIVMGARVVLLGHQIERRVIRHVLGRLSATAASLAVGIRIYDIMCGAKMFRVTPRTRAIFARPFRSRWVFDAEWLARFMNAPVDDEGPRGRLVCELPLRQWNEVPGSKVRMSDFLAALWDLFKIGLRYRCGFGQPAGSGRPAAEGDESGAASQAVAVNERRR